MYLMERVSLKDVGQQITVESCTKKRNVILKENVINRGMAGDNCFAKEE